MKKNASALSMLLLAASLWSCGDNRDGDDTSATADSTTNTTTNTTTISSDTAGMAVGTATAMNTTPLQGADSAFVMEAAMSGMMEVEAGRLAEQNGAHPRVKEYGAMMVRDHTNANNELKSLASAKGMMLPDTLSGKMRQHVEAMRKMTGKAFDRHYVNMMQTAHKTDISKFEKTSNSGNDADLKNWTAKQLPVLRTHKDSADGLAKMKL